MQWTIYKKHLTVLIVIFLIKTKVVVHISLIVVMKINKQYLKLLIYINLINK